VLLGIFGVFHRFGWGSPRLAWRLGRWFPALVEKLGESALAAERKALK
jgi:hypothetical protein